jgi:hypothetical protein
VVDVQRIDRHHHDPRIAPANQHPQQRIHENHRQRGEGGEDQQAGQQTAPS